MKVMLVAGGKKGTHTVRWANGLVSRGVDVHLVTQQKLCLDLDNRVKLYKLPVNGPLGYYFNYFSLKKLFKKIRPDIVNAHYASGYGTLSRLSKSQPLLLSVWGSDVYDFPDKNFINEKIVNKNLDYADAVASTSKSMASYIKKRFCVNKPVFITPFGVDVDYFSPLPKKEEGKKVVIGTVKTLSNKYGIDTLIKAFKLVDDNLGKDYSLSLEISGDGPELEELVRLTKQLKVDDKVVFHGFVDKEKVLYNLREMDIYVALSRLESESFGVALVEAASCEKPVVVSNVSGPAEVVKDGVTGFIVPKDNPKLAAEKIINLILNPDMRVMMGRAGRQHVYDLYTWEKSLDTMISAYKKVMDLGK